MEDIMSLGKLKQISSLAVAVALSFSLMTGCSGKQETATQTSEQQAAETASATTAAPVDPLGKYDQVVEVAVVNSTNSTVQYPEGQSLEENVWTKEYLDALNIKVKYLWVADDQQYFQKMAVTIASDDLPDIFPVNAQQLSDLVESDSLADLTGIYDQYASPLTKEIIGQDETVFNLGKRNGKIYAIPNTAGSSAYDQVPLLFVREDWRKKLNLPEPKTMADFEKLADAFVNQDPDGNGKNDTFALSLTKSLVRTDGGTGTQGFGGLAGFANAYHAYPNTWIKDSTGKTVYGSIQPEVKIALQKLQDMYKSGQLDKEFAVKDFAKAAEAAAAGKVGMEFGMMWNPFYPLQSTIENNPEADWRAYPVPTSDDQALKVQTQSSAMYYWVVKKDFEHPEAAIKMLNLFAEKLWGETADNNLGSGDGASFVPFKYSLLQVFPAMKNLDSHKNVVAALKSNDSSKLSVEDKVYFDNITTYLKTGDVKIGWGANKIFGDVSSFSVISQYLANDSILFDIYHNSPTPTMVEKMSTLDKMETEAFTKIIMGSSIDEFDTFVQNWKKLGGDQITQEMNEQAK
jgi:putative aldouronate transport system substrate-binding protein